nr:CYP4C33-like protein 1 [Diaphanosoma celebensis]
MAIEVIRELINFTPSSLITLPLLCVGLSVTFMALSRRRAYMKLVDKVPGPPAQIPFFGSVTDVLVNPDDFIKYILQLFDTWRPRGPVLRLWIGHYPVFIITTAEATEVLLSSNKFIDKSPDYDYLHPWLGTGLLTSTGTKWFGRRKMLTPAFHFKILEDFAHVFNEQSQILVSKLNETLRNERELDIYQYITRCTLDIICETAMGRHVDAQNQRDSDYVQAVYKMGDIVQLRQVRPWLQPDLLFQLTSYGAEQKRCLKILHDFTDKVIREKKLEHQQRQKAASEQTADDDLNLSKKRRLAFLDLLIESSQDGLKLNDMDIREEVDTFMFEGHDTTAAAINWSLFLIGSHPHVQKEVDDELSRVFGDSDRPVSMTDLSELKYLECCIKEALRLYPSVPILARTLNEDAKMHDYDIPSGSRVLLFTYSLHRDPRYFPDPEKFDPERFFPENVRGRHPYAYVPFSAGPRNCIGQKFALMEEKVVLSTVLRNFHIESLDKREELVLMGQLILRPRDGIRLRMTPKRP